MRHLNLLILVILHIHCAAQKKLDLSRPEDVLKAQRKIQASLQDGEACFYTWEGVVYSRMPHERDRLLFLCVGMNVRAMVTVKDSLKGEGYRQVSREVLIYLDPKTKQILKVWKNPWTSKEVEVMHVLNDPVNMRGSAFVSQDAPQDFRKLAGTIYWDIQIPLWYPNVLAGDYQQYVGGMYQAMEIFNFMVEESELIAPKNKAEYVWLSWTRVGQWLPWMEMGDLQGQLIYNGTGKKLNRFEEIPPILRDFIRSNHPEFMTPPPLEDKRPNETSWSSFKKMLDAKKKR